MSSWFRWCLSSLLSFTDKIHKVVFDGQPLRYLEAFAYSKEIVTFMLWRLLYLQSDSNIYTFILWLCKVIVTFILWPLLYLPQLCPKHSSIKPKYLKWCKEKCLLFYILLSCFTTCLNSFPNTPPEVASVAPHAHSQQKSYSLMLSFINGLSLYFCNSAWGLNLLILEWWDSKNGFGYFWEYSFHVGLHFTPD